MRIFGTFLPAVLLAAAFSPLAALSVETSEISVDLRLDAQDYVSGERIRAVVDIANSSPDRISYGYSNSKDSFFIELYRAADMRELKKTSKGAFVARFRIDSGEGQKLETFLGDHFALKEPDRYLAKPVLVHGRVRYEGRIRAFDVVNGVKMCSAMQMFSNRRNLQRDFELVHWSRGRGEHLFLKAFDSGLQNRRWVTRDLGPILRIDKPSISILKNGEIIVLHRLNQDQFVRTEFWSLPDALEFRGCTAVQDPDTAGTARVRELYKDGAVKPKENPWWKFW